MAIIILNGAKNNLFPVAKKVDKAGNTGGRIDEFDFPRLTAGIFILTIYSDLLIED